VWARDDVFEGHAAEVRQLPRLPRAWAGGDERERAPVIGGEEGRRFLPGEKKPVARAELAVRESGRGSEISRAEPGPRVRAGAVAAARLVERVDVARAPDEIAAGQHREVPGANLPLGHERAPRAMRAHGARALAELVVHEQRERPVAVRVRAEAVGRADHPVALHRVAHREDRFHLRARLRGDEIGLGRRARADVAAERDGADRKRRRRNHHSEAEDLHVCRVANVGGGVTFSGSAPFER